MNDDQWDSFLNDAVYAIVDKWYDATGTTLNTENKYELNDLLTEFFSNQTGFAE